MPTDAHALGHAGEAAAADFYRQAGYEVLAQGYRHGRAEVDLVLRQGAALLVFAEVKTRSGSQFGPPETFVSVRKGAFRLAATHLQEELDWRGDIRFDIVALTQLSTGFRIGGFRGCVLLIGKELSLRAERSNRTWNDTHAGRSGAIASLCSQ
ncbi:MAG: YraN family protein [Hymenobacter sp.]